MNDALRLARMVFHGTMLLLVWSFMPMLLPPAHSQLTEPVPMEPVVPPPSGGIDRECRAALERLCTGIEPGSGRLRTCYEDNKGKLTPSCRQQVQERKSEAAAIMGMTPLTPSQEGEPRIEHKRVRPSETYLAGFGGYTFGGKFSDVEGTGFLSGLNLNDRDLADAGVYGGKLGHFFGDQMDWLGVEMEAFNTTPHVEQHGLVPGSHFRVTTLAFNLIGRLKLGCKTKTERTETRTERDDAMKPDMSGSFAGCNPMLGSGLASSLPISRPMATACPTMPCRASMPWRGYAITSPNASHCLVNTNTTMRCSMRRRMVPSEDQGDSKAITRPIIWSEGSPSTSESWPSRRAGQGEEIGLSSITNRRGMSIGRHIDSGPRRTG